MTISYAVTTAPVLADLDNIGAEAFYAVDRALDQSATDALNEWRSNAEETAGDHGHWYPKAIEKERLSGLAMSGTIAYRVRPNPSRRQGAMSFEYGSVNQPAHLDCLRAMDVVGPTIRPRVRAALAFS